MAFGALVITVKYSCHEKTNSLARIIFLLCILIYIQIAQMSILFIPRKSVDLIDSMQTNCTFILKHKNESCAENTTANIAIYNASNPRQLTTNTYIFNVFFSASFLQPLVAWCFTWQHYLSVCLFCDQAKLTSKTLLLIRGLGTLITFLLYFAVVVARSEAEIINF